MTALRQFLRDVWTLAIPYWFSEDRWPARGLLAVLVAMNLGLVYLNVLFNRWNNAFYNTLQDKNYGAFTHQLGVFTGLAATFIIVAVYQLYLNQMLQIRWRRWLTDHYLDAWLADRAYYRMQLVGGSTDNPDQRIAEDLRLFVARTLALSLGLLSAVVTLASFIAILWGLSGAATLPLGATGLTIPGFMVWTALVYAIAGTWLTHKIGRPLIRLNFDQQRFEADFRFNLVRFRDAIDRVRSQVGGMRVSPGADARLALERVDLALPNGQPLLGGVSVSVARGDVVLITGPSGAGKSTLFRAIAGIWPFGRGEIHRPEHARVLFLPQIPYLPIGTLREVVAYPMPAAGVGDRALPEALAACW